MYVCVYICLYVCRAPETMPAHTKVCGADALLGNFKIRGQDSKVKDEMSGKCAEGTPAKVSLGSSQGLASQQALSYLHAA